MAELLGEIQPANLPVRYRRDEKPEPPEEGIGLCLSGGGFRAMLFHAGALWRLNELGVLAKVDRISSVSGGSITAGYLGYRWNNLDRVNGVIQNFEEQIVDPIRRLASDTIDVNAALLGLLWWGTPGKYVAGYYRNFLFRLKPTLQDLPDYPRFVLNSTCTRTGVLWRFSKPYAASYLVGLIRKPKFELADVVAASSAFPPVLSPVRLKLDPNAFEATGRGKLFKEPFNTQARLTDGGVYDNLGLETVFKNFRTVLVSDAGAPFAVQEKPKADWLRSVGRTISLIDKQVRSLRVSALMASFKAPDKTGLFGRYGAYWDLDTYTDRNVPGALPVSPASRMALSAVGTRLAGMDRDLQERLINWGYASCDASVRKFWNKGLPPPSGWPYPKNSLA